MQIKHNFNLVLREATKSQSVVWQQLARSCIIYITERAETDKLLPILQKELEFLPEGSVVVRVPCLPMNCLIEMELLC